MCCYDSNKRMKKMNTYSLFKQVLAVGQNLAGLAVNTESVICNDDLTFACCVIGRGG